MSLTLIQIVDDTAVIDSRRYCAEVIEVNHGDWFQNVLLKHQAEIEQRFGALRFENGVLKHSNYRGSVTEKFAYMTEVQTNALLVLSRNTAKVRERKFELIAEFEQYKQMVKRQLERQLTLTASDIPGYPHDWIELWQHSGIANKYHVRDAIERDFIEGKHYHWEGQTLQISKQCYLVLMLSFRSKKGVTVDLSTEIKQIDWQELSSYEQRRKSNTRLPRKGYDNGQLELFN